MKRLMVVNVHFAPFSYGGATVVAENMAAALARDHGWQVLAVTTFYDSTIVPYTMKRYAARGVDVVGICVPRHGLSYEQGYDNPEFDAALLRIADAFMPDAAHVHCLQTMGAGFLPELARRGIPAAVTIHDAWWHCERQFMVTSRGRFCHQERIDPDVCRACVEDPERSARRRERLAQRLAAVPRYLFPSDYFRRLGIANGLAPEKCFTNRNGVVFPRASWRKVPPKPGVRLRFGFVGGPGPNKGAVQMLGAFRASARTDYELIVVDAAQNAGTSWQLGFDWRVPGTQSFHPAYTMETIDDFFARIDVLLFPSQWKESFGLTVREALARDVWVITTDAGGASEDCIDGVNASVIPMSASHRPLQDAIETLLDRHDPLAHANPEKARIATIASQAAELDGMLRQIASPDAAARPQHSSDLTR